MTPKETAHLIVTEDQPISYGLSSARTFETKLLEARIEKAIADAVNEARVSPMELVTAFRAFLVEFVSRSGEKCRLDHKGFCQAHGSPEPCLMNRVREFMRDH